MLSQAILCRRLRDQCGDEAGRSPDGPKPRLTCHSPPVLASHHGLASGDIQPGWTLTIPALVSASLASRFLCRRCTVGSGGRGDRNGQHRDPPAPIGVGMIALQFRQPDPAIIARWRGPDGDTGGRGDCLPSTHPCRHLDRPPGNAGRKDQPGPEGPVPGIIDGGTFN